MRLRWFAPFVAALFIPTDAGADRPPQLAGVIERIVAIVDDDVVLLSELRTRARPFQKQIDSATKPGPMRVAAESQMRRELLEKIIDERLLAREAQRRDVQVTPDDVDAALRTVASSQSVSVAQLMFAAQGAGLSERQYREELRRQLIEGRLVQARVLGRIKGLSKLSEPARTERIEKERRAWMEELRSVAFVEVRL